MITCYYGPGIELTKKQSELLNKGVVILVARVKEIWEGIKERGKEIIEGFIRVISDIKTELRILEKPNYINKSYYLESQVTDRKPSCVRIRNNC